MWIDEAVFERARERGLKINLEKSVFFRESLKYVGRIVSGEGVGVDPEYVSKIAAWTAPTSRAEVRSFLGTASFVRRFCPNLADALSIITPLLETNRPFK